MAQTNTERGEREAEVAALIERAKDPNDPYDGHHGTDRSPEALEHARAHNPEAYERVVAKMALPGGEYRG